MIKQVTSQRNPFVKSVLELQQKSSERSSQGLFVAEGRREVHLALANKIDIEYVIFCPEIYENDPSYPTDFKSFNQTKLVEVSPEVYNRLAYRENVEGIMIIAKVRQVSLHDLDVSINPLFIVLEGVEKPGNLGAVLRTADAVGADGVIVCDSKTDFHNPNAIRASMGCVFTVPVVTCTSAQAIEWLKKNKITIHAAALETEILYTDSDFTKPSAIAFGTEKFGLTKNWTDNSDIIVKIPMKGLIDSLNLSVSMAILAYEAIRQRTFS